MLEIQCFIEGYSNIEGSPLLLDVSDWGNCLVVVVVVGGVTVIGCIRSWLFLGTNDWYQKAPAVVPHIAPPCEERAYYLFSTLYGCIYIATVDLNWWACLV